MYNLLTRHVKRNIDSESPEICYLSIIGGNDKVKFSKEIKKSLKKIGNMVCKLWLHSSIWRLYRDEKHHWCFMYQSVPSVTIPPGNARVFDQNFCPGVGI